MKITSEHFIAAGLSVRPVQMEYKEAVEVAFSASNRTALLSAETGVGKTLGYLSAAMNILSKNPDARFIIATSTHALMSQIVNHDQDILAAIAEQAGMKIPSFSRLLGRSNYVSPAKAQSVYEQYFQYSGSDEEKQILQALASWNETFPEFVEEYGSLPDHVTPDMVCYSMYDNPGPVREAQQSALKSRIVLTSHAMLMIDYVTGGSIIADKANRYLIIDEADLFVDAADAWRQRRLNLTDFLHACHDFFPNACKEALRSMIESVRQAASGQVFISNSECAELYKSCLRELRFICSSVTDPVLREHLETMLTTWDIAFISGAQTGVGVSTVLQEPALVFLNPYICRGFGKYATEYAASLLTSATLSITSDPAKGTSWLRDDLGIGDDSVSIMDIFSPPHYGFIDITLAGSQFPQIFENAEESVFSKEWLICVADHIKALNQPVVVLTGSHKESAQIAEVLGECALPIYVQKSGHKLREYTEQFIDRPGILISAGASVGMSLRDKQGNQIFSELIITRIRFSARDRDAAISTHYYLKSRGSDLSVAQIERNIFMQQLQRAIRTGKQAIGRGIRSENDSIHLSVMDPRFPEPTDISSKYRVLVNIIPTRFASQYRKSKILSPAILGELLC